MSLKENADKTFSKENEEFIWVHIFTYYMHVEVQDKTKSMSIKR